MSAHASPGPRTRLVLVRHGETDSNASGRFQGQADIPLNDTGRAQAGAVAARMVEFAPARIVASDLSRAQATASAIAEAWGWLMSRALTSTGGANGDFHARSRRAGE